MALASVQGAWNTLSGSEAGQATSTLTQTDDSAFKFLDLTRTQRLYGFGFCLVAGCGLSILGAILFTLVSCLLPIYQSEFKKSPSSNELLVMRIQGQVTLFATFYVVGVIISLIGTGFLVGFGKQIKMMWDPARRYAAALFLLFIALTLVFAFAVEIDILVIVFAICTFLSYAWYTLSYIPYARAFAKKLNPF